MCLRYMGMHVCPCACVFKGQFWQYIVALELNSNIDRLLLMSAHMSGDATLSGSEG